MVLDIDASIVICHSEKQDATPTWKKTFGYHPIFCFLDNTGEALSALLRPGRAGSNTAADHITVLDHALAQIPDHLRHGTPILIRADTAGCTKAFLQRIRALREDGVDARFSVGAPIEEKVRQAICMLAERAWSTAIDADGEIRQGAQVADLSGLLSGDGLPEGTRLLVRRERPHPGAQLDLFDTVEGWRHQLIATDTPATGASPAWLDARHRAHARVQDRIRTGKDTGFGRFPSRVFAINAAWLELALTAIDLLAWTRALLLDGALATHRNPRHPAGSPPRLRSGGQRHKSTDQLRRPVTREGRQVRMRPAATALVRRNSRSERGCECTRASSA